MVALGYDDNLGGYIPFERPIEGNSLCPLITSSTLYCLLECLISSVLLHMEGYHVQHGGAPNEKQARFMISIRSDGV